MKIPKSLGACADLLYQLRESRIIAQRAVDAIEVDEKLLKEHIINNLPKSDMTGASGKLANVKVVTKEVPRVDDWDQLHRYVVDNQAWELMHKRVSDGAVKERWDAGVEVPGVGRFKAVTLSVTKV